MSSAIAWTFLALNQPTATDTRRIGKLHLMQPSYAGWLTGPSERTPKQSQILHTVHVFGKACCVGSYAYSAIWGKPNHASVIFLHI